MNELRSSLQKIYIWWMNVLGTTKTTSIFSLNSFTFRGKLVQSNAYLQNKISGNL